MKKLTQKATLWQNVSVPPARPDPRVQMRGIKLFRTERRKIVSGSGQAKAKKKSAKKTAAELSKLAPEPSFNNRARLEEFTIGNVRCFAEEQRVPIRPITLLIGENSVGKTTFLGGYRAIHNLTHYARRNIRNSVPGPNFNDAPFAMGAFRDIVNHGRVAGAASDFQLGGKMSYRAVTDGVVAWGHVSVIYSFMEAKSGADAVPYKATFVFSNGEKLDVVAEAHRYGDYQNLCVIDPDTGARVTIYDFPSRSIALPEIANMFARIARVARGEVKWEKKGNMKNIADFLVRQFCPDRKDLLMVEFCNNLAEYSLAPIRSKPKRTYDPVSDEYNPEGGHIPMFLAQISRTRKKEWDALRKRLVDFGKESGLFSDFKVKGLGKHVSNPFQIHVKSRGGMSNLIDVGYGVGQIYPLLVQIMLASQRKTPAVFLLQEPEVHLHPQAQAALTSFFAKSTKDDGHAFIIETHGDSIIDRVRICVSNGLIPPEDVVILFFEPQTRGSVKIHPIMMDKMANLQGAPKGYRDFFMEEGDRLLGFKKLPKTRSHVRHR